MKLKIRDGHATINGESGCLEIIADDGRALFSVGFDEGGSIYVSAVGICRHEGKVLEDSILVQPTAGNMVRVFRKQSELIKSK